MRRKIGIQKNALSLREIYTAISLLGGILLFLLFTACSSSKQAQNSRISIKKHSIEWSLQKEQTVFYKGVENFSHFAYCYDEMFEQEHLVSYNEKSQTFSIFDYNTSELISQFRLEHPIHSMYVHNIDSIFVCYNSIFGGKGTIFGLFNRKGEVLNNYNMTQDMVISDLNKVDNYGNTLKLKVNLVDNPYSFTNFCFFENSLYLNISPQTNLQNKFLYPSMAIAPIANRNEQTYSYMFNYPEMYKQAQYFKSDYMDFIVTKDYAKTTNVIISHTLSDSIEINRLVPRFVANNHLIFDTPEYDTLIYKQVKSKFKGNMYVANNDIGIKSTFLGFKYPYLKYDKFRNIYYRIAVHSTDIEKLPTDYLHIKADYKARDIVTKYQNWSIIVTDSLLNRFDEITFASSQNLSPNIIVTKNGLGIISNDRQTDSLGINIIKYKVMITHN